MLEKDCAAAIWLGDMNWTNKDDEMQLPAGWCDLWKELCPEHHGHTFHANQGRACAVPARLDRILAKGLKNSGYVGRVGTGKIPGTNCFPSDHYGLFAECSINIDEG